MRARRSLLVRLLRSRALQALQALLGWARCPCRPCPCALSDARWPQSYAISGRRITQIDAWACQELIALCNAPIVGSLPFVLGCGEMQGGRVRSHEPSPGRARRSLSRHAGSDGDALLMSALMMGSCGAGGRPGRPGCRADGAVLTPTPMPCAGFHAVDTQRLALAQHQRFASLSTCALAHSGVRGKRGGTWVRWSACLGRGTGHVRGESQTAGDVSAGGQLEARGSRLSHPLTFPF